MFSVMSTHAYAQVHHRNIILMRPHKDKYTWTKRSESGRPEYVLVAARCGLIDGLSQCAERLPRQVQLAYAQLLGAYLTAAGQLKILQSDAGDALGFSVTTSATFAERRS